MIKKLPSTPSLKEVESFALSEITDAAVDRGHHFRNVVFSTIGDEGVASRILVLRKATSNPFAVQLHTDLRSGKVTELERDGRASILLWNPAIKCQVRLKVEAKTIVKGSDILTAWAETRGPSRASYNTCSAPGSEMDGEYWRPAAQRETANSMYFGIIHCITSEMEVLVLRREGHLRARFKYGFEGRAAACFLVP